MSGFSQSEYLTHGPNVMETLPALVTPKYFTSLHFYYICPITFQMQLHCHILSGFTARFAPVFYLWMSKVVSYERRCNIRKTFFPLAETLLSHRWKISPDIANDLQEPLNPLQWLHNEHDGVSNHQTHNCLLNRLFKAQIKENIKAPRHWPLCEEFTGDRWIPPTKGQ